MNQDNQNFTALYRPTLIQQIARLLGFYHPAPIDMDVLELNPNFAQGYMTQEISVVLDIPDRLRVLLRGSIQLTLKTKTDVAVNRLKTTTSIGIPWERPEGYKEKP